MVDRKSGQRMNQTFVRRVRMALGVWRLVRYQSQLCRWMPIAVADDTGQVPANEVEAARWVGSIRLGRQTHHALFVPPASHAAYRHVAPPRSRLVAWCGLMPDGLPEGASVEFVATIHDYGASPERTARLRLTQGRAPEDRRWHRLVLELQNHEAQQIELTLETRLESSGRAVKPVAVWGDPRLEWPRPMGELRGILVAAGRLGLRGRLMDAARTLHGRLSERSHASPYQMWLRQRSPSPGRLAEMRNRAGSLTYRPLVSVVTPVYNTDARWLRACVESVKSQAYPNWQLCLVDDGSTRAETQALLREYEGDSRIKIKRLTANSGIAAASNEALALAEGEYVAFLDHDDELAPDALFEVVAHLNEHQDADFIYSDEDKLELDGGRSGVYFKPGWSPEHFLTNMYTCHLMVVRRALVERIGGFRPGYEGAQDYDLVLRLIDHTARIHHLPKVLYQWRKIPESTAGSEGAKPWAHDAGRLALEDYVRRNQLNAEILPGGFQYMYRVRYRVQGEPLISIVLPALRDVDASGSYGQRACERVLAMLDERTTYRRFEVVLPVGGLCDCDLKIPRNLTVRRVPVEGMPMRWRLQQQKRAAVHAGGDHLLFLDWGLQAMDGDWLTALLEFSQQSPIGAVGAKLHHSDGSLRHIGILLGVNGVAAPAFHHHPRSSMGYWGTAIAARNYSAVSGECLMTRRAVYDQVGGFDDQMGSLADVDYCLRVTAAGYRVVFTPHAALVHEDPASQSSNVDAQDANQLHMRWSDRLARDPYYNSNLSRDSPDYEPDLSVHAEEPVNR
jgi:glycosyltransferase involved in cell wall biosynthesis